MVDGLENRGPGRDTDTGTDEDCDFVLEDVLCRGSVGTVNAESGHLLTVLKRNLVHAHGVELVVKLGLRLTSAESISKSAGEITDLTDVNRNVRVIGAGGNGKWMPLVVTDIRAVEEKPLSRLVLHAGLGELNLNSICSLLVGLFDKRSRILLTVWVANDLDNLGLAPATNLTVQTVHEVQAAAYKLPSPSLVTNAVGPEVVVIKGRKGLCSVTHEAAGCVCVHAEQERDEEVVRVPKRLERLLSDPVMGCGVDQKHA